MRDRLRLFSTPRFSLPAALLATLLSLLIILPSPVRGGGVDWNKATRIVKDSTVRLTFPVELKNPSTGETIQLAAVCSGFVINTQLEYVMSANHCWGPGVTVDGKAADVMFWDKDADVLVLRVEGLEKKALKPSTKPLTIGMPIAAFGYARGSKFPTLRVGVISAVDAVFPAWDLTGTWLVIDTPYIGGMSGGPVYDISGHIVGIVQRASEAEGIGRSISDLLQLTQKFWE